MELFEITNNQNAIESSRIMKLRETLLSIGFWNVNAHLEELILYLNRMIPVESCKVTLGNHLTIKLKSENPSSFALDFYTYFNPAYQLLLTAHKDEIIYYLGYGRIDDPSIYATFDRLINSPTEVGLMYNLQYLADNTIEVVL